MEGIKQYNAFAQIYSDVFLKYNQESIQAYYKYFTNDMKGKKVLDLGCGDGRDLAVVKSKGADIYGIDSSEEMLHLAQQKNPSGTIQLGYFDNIPFADKTFDYVISKWALQTSDFIDPIYQEIIRVLKPNGVLTYLTCHPLRQFLEKKRKEKNYFAKEIVESTFFEGKVTAFEPSHTLNEYLSAFFFNHFALEAYEEGLDAAAEKIDGDIYPSYFIIQARLK